MKVTLLDKSDINSSSTLALLVQQDTLQPYAVQASDFAVLTGAFLDKYLENNNHQRQYAQFVWTKSKCKYIYNNENLDLVMDISTKNNISPDSRDACIVPVINLNEAEKEKDFEIINTVPIGNGIVKLAKVGSYPQSLADIETSAKLTRALKRNKLTETGKTYTINGLPMLSKGNDTRPQTYITLKEYEFEGNKYVQVVASLSQLISETRESVHLDVPCRYVKNKKPYWVKVEPLIWMVDEEKEILISNKAILSGIRFNHTTEYNGDFSQTEMKAFCDTYLSNEITSRGQISLNNFKSFAMAQLKNKVDSMQRVEYFQKLIQTTKSYLGKSITDGTLSSTEKEIVQYTKQHIQNMIAQPNILPQEMLNQFCQKQDEDKVKNNNISGFLWFKHLFSRN